MSTQISGDTGVSQCQPNSVSQGDLVSDALGAALLAENGYQKLPNGLIIQWGASSTDTNGDSNFAFPVPFTTLPHVVYQVKGVIPVTINQSFLSNSAASIQARNVSASPSPSQVAYSYIAIGY